jgi:hypothetical protein
MKSTGTDLFIYLIGLPAVSALLIDVLGFRNSDYGLAILFGFWVVGAAIYKMLRLDDERKE